LCLDPGSSNSISKSGKCDKEGISANWPPSVDPVGSHNIDVTLDQIHS
jgi:hypothetical protein